MCINPIPHMKQNAYPTSRNPNPCLDNSPRISTPPPVLQLYTDRENRGVLGHLATRMLLADGSYILHTRYRHQATTKATPKISSHTKMEDTKTIQQYTYHQPASESCHAKFVSELDRNSSMLSKVCPVSLAAVQRSLSR